MRPEDVISRMSQLAHHAAGLPAADPALRALLAELQALSRLLPATPLPASATDERFDNLPV